MSDKKTSDKEEIDGAQSAYRQALQYGKDLARIYKIEKSEREKYEMLFNLSPDGILIIDKKGTIHSANPAISLMLLGSQKKKILGKQFQAFIAPGKKKNCIRNYKKVIKDEIHAERLETDLVREDKTKFPAEVSIGRIEWEGKPAAQIIVRDISETRMAMELLEQKVAERTQELTMLYAVAASGNEFNELNLILERALGILVETAPCIAGVVHLANNSNELLETSVISNLTSKQVEKLNASIVKENIWIKLTTKNVQVFHNNDKFSILGLKPNIYLGLPLRAEGQPLGVLSLIFDSDYHLSDNDLNLFISIADQIGGFIQSAQLREKVEETAVLGERQRLARDLHDSVTQLLYSLTLFAKAGQKNASLEKWEAVEHYLTRFGETAQQALKEMRLLIFELKPAILEKSGLVHAVKNRLELVESKAGVDVTFKADSWTEPSPPIQLGFYRIIQESLNNILKHSKATHVEVNLSSDDTRFKLKVIDNGDGFEVKSASERGMGLTNMRERAEKLGGTLTIESLIGKGTKISACVENREEQRK